MELVSIMVRCEIVVENHRLPRNCAHAPSDLGPLVDELAAVQPLAEFGAIETDAIERAKQTTLRASEGRRCGRWGRTREARKNNSEGDENTIIQFCIATQLQISLIFDPNSVSL